ncbi:MAG: hypothetical protein C4289_15890, partial [Chloroflexota bacterium]
QVKRDAAIGEARAQQEAEHVRYAAQTEIEAARRDYEIRKAAFDADVARHRAEADLAYDLQRFRTAQAVKQEEVKVAIVEKDPARAAPGERDRASCARAPGDGDAAG